MADIENVLDEIGTIVAPLSTRMSEHDWQDIDVAYREMLGFYDKGRVHLAVGSARLLSADIKRMEDVVYVRDSFVSGALNSLGRRLHLFTELAA
jgi:hypothetical protein